MTIAGRTWSSPAAMCRACASITTMRAGIQRAGICCRQHAEREYSGAAVADLNGDYRRELLLGNIQTGTVPIYSAEWHRAVRQSRRAADGRGRPSAFRLRRWTTAATCTCTWATGRVARAPTARRRRCGAVDGAVLYPWDTQAHTTSADSWTSVQLHAQVRRLHRRRAHRPGDRLGLRHQRDAAQCRRRPGAWHFENETDRDRSLPMRTAWAAHCWTSTMTAIWSGSSRPCAIPPAHRWATGASRATGCIAMPARRSTLPSPTSPSRPACATATGAGAPARRISTMTASSTCSMSTASATSRMTWSRPRTPHAICRAITTA